MIKLTDRAGYLPNTQVDSNVIFFIPLYVSGSGRHYVGQGNVNILQHLQSGRRSGVITNHPG